MNDNINKFGIDISDVYYSEIIGCSNYDKYLNSVQSSGE